MIKFEEDESSGYGPRTLKNAKLADATIALAIDFSTSGEKLTEHAVLKVNKYFLKLQLGFSGKIKKFEAEKLENFIKLCKRENVTSLNIAGNGIYTLSKYGITQESVDETIYKLIKYMIKKGCNIKSIRSGGQTGADEAGLKAGLKLELETTCLCPKGWRFRTKIENVADEQRFKGRFD